MHARRLAYFVSSRTHCLYPPTASSGPQPILLARYFVIAYTVSTPNPFSYAETANHIARSMAGESFQSWLHCKCIGVLVLYDPGRGGIHASSDGFAMRQALHMV
ncbi:hypothetical protein DPSP01_009943 [Paraphaeosphaeria sporulosa]